MSRRIAVRMLGGAGLLTLSVACGQTSSPAPTGAPGTSASGSASVSQGGPETNPAADIPDSQAFVSNRAADGKFTVWGPEGWSRTADGPAVLFRDKFNSVRI